MTMEGADDSNEGRKEEKAEGTSPAKTQRRESCGRPHRDFPNPSPIPNKTFKAHVF